MSFIPKNEPRVVFNDEQATFSNGSEIDSGFINVSAASGILLNIAGSVGGLTLVQENRTSASGNTETTTVPLPASLPIVPLQFPARAVETRFRLQNNTGSTISNVRFDVKLTIAEPTITPLAFAPLPQSQATLTQSVLIGLDANGTYRNSSVNQTGALLVSNYKEEIARGLYDGYLYGVKFGRNPDIDINSAPEDIYNGGGEYTGFNATANEEISVSSDDNDDRGALVSSGNATGGSNTTLIDNTATFISDGVAVGDIVLNDTQGVHGIVTEVTSQTTLTVFSMQDGAGDLPVNVSGDSYRVATAIDTGAAVLKLKNILDEDFVQQEDVYIILDGTSTVTTSGVNAMRCPTGRIVLSGSSGRNEGDITVNQAVSTSNVFCVIPTFGSTTIACFTVPAGKDCLITNTIASITRANGSAGSATIAVNVRKFGQGFSAERVYELQTGSPIDETTIIGPLPSGTDIKGTVEQASDNNTIAQIEFEYYFIDKA